MEIACAQHHISENQITRTNHMFAGQFLALLDFLQLQVAFQEKEDENLRLKHYIDTILLNIVENYPQILEVKNVGGPEKR